MIEYRALTKEKQLWGEVWVVMLVCVCHWAVVTWLSPASRDAVFPLIVIPAGTDHCWEVRTVPLGDQ